MLIRQNPYRHHAPPGWSDMTSAPRDGTVIEVQCNYGVAPWFGLYSWTKPQFGSEKWCKVGDEGSGFTEDASFSWRPRVGSPHNYVDPTFGAQETRAYWLRACGHDPRDYPGSELTFEEEAKIERTKPEPKKRGLIERLFGS